MVKPSSTLEYGVLRKTAKPERRASLPHFTRDEVLKLQNIDHLCNRELKSISLE